MTTYLNFAPDHSEASCTKTEGIAPVVCYEPWFPRALEAIKQSIHDGHPVLIRLHSASSYPAKHSDPYAMDLESHAVLIVGYDDTKQAVALIDPWNNAWGGNLGGRRWLSYTALETQTVNTSLGMVMPLAPLDVASCLQYDEVQNLSLHLEVGFYIPRGTVMDLSSWAIDELEIKLQLPDSWGGQCLKRIRAGSWTVGTKASFSFPLVSSPQDDGEVLLSVKARVVGKRPYDFVDYISVHRQITAEGLCKKTEYLSLCSNV